MRQRLPTGSHAEAAHGGLQDSAPKAGQLSLHARVDDVAPSSWEDPALVQIWGPREADYIVPRQDVGVFTMGRLPRDADQHRSLDDIADAVHEVLGGQALLAREAYDALPALGRPDIFVKLATRTGRIHIRWDASKIWIIPADRPDVDPEDARLELARWFLRWLGPATMERFAWWAGIEPKEAQFTWQALGDELLPVRFGDRERFIHRSDEETLMSPEPVKGVRILPPDDPYLKVDHDLLVPKEEHRSSVFWRKGRSAGFALNVLLVDGEIVGRVARQQANVRIEPWRKLTKRVVEAATAEAEGISRALGRPGRVTWAEP